MIKYVRGDLFTTDARVIAHGVNCQGVMGSGVALIVKTKFPKAYHYYRDWYETDGWYPGDVQFVEVYGDRYIANCATQDTYLPRNICHADYEAIEKCMKQLYVFSKARNLTVAMPKIGAGLAGGDWSRIEKIINDVFEDVEVLVYHLD